MTTPGPRRPRYGVPTTSRTAVLTLTATILGSTTGLQVRSTDGVLTAARLDEGGLEPDDRPAAQLVERMLDLPDADPDALATHLARRPEHVPAGVLARLRGGAEVPGAGPGALALAAPVTAYEATLVADAGDGAYESADLGWIEDAHGTIWRVEVDAGALVEDPSATPDVLVTPADPATLRDEVATLLRRIG